MGVINREFDLTERRRVDSAEIGPVATSATYLIKPVPYACTLDAMQVHMNGLSGIPVITPYLFRFLPGVGLTSWAIGGSFAALEYGLSGSISVSLIATGSTLLNFITNDVIGVVTGAANTGANVLDVGVVLRATEDYRKSFGI